MKTILSQNVTLTSTTLPYRRKLAERPFSPSSKVPRSRIIKPGRSLTKPASKSRTAGSPRPQSSLSPTVQHPFVRRPIVCKKLIRQPKLKSDAEAEGPTATLPSRTWPPNQVYSPKWLRRRSRSSSSSSKKQRKLHSSRGSSSRGRSQRPKLASRRPRQEARPLLPHLKIFARGR